MMENNSVLNDPYLNKYNVYETVFNRERISVGNPYVGPVNFSLTAEFAVNFFRYLKSFNLFNESQLLMLSPNNYYYYEEQDLKCIRTLINLKKLNLIKDLDTFLQTLYSILPPDVNFVGCFSDSKTPKGNGFLSELSARFSNLLDTRTEQNLDKKDVSELLEKYDFHVVDMTEMNGITYFYSQYVRQTI